MSKSTRTVPKLVLFVAETKPSTWDNWRPLTAVRPCKNQERVVERLKGYHDKREKGKWMHLGTRADYRVVPYVRDDKAEPVLVV